MQERSIAPDCDKFCGCYSEIEQVEQHLERRFEKIEQALEEMKGSNVGGLEAAVAVLVRRVRMLEDGRTGVFDKLKKRFGM